MKRIITTISLLSILGAFVVFYLPIFQGKVPSPLDTLVGLYHPYFDFFAKGNPNFRGVPFKNFLIGDPVVQILPWKNLVVSSLREGVLPVWNPYQMAGYPLLGNIQSSAFYPLNIFLYVLPFLTGWTIVIISQQILAFLFMYLYLKNLRLEKIASMFGAFIFAFCGFTIAWFEWGTIISSALWLPLLLLAIDKIAEEKRRILWTSLLVFGFMCSYLGGHLQTFFYSSVLSGVYLLSRSYQRKDLKILFYGMGGLFIGSILLLPLIIPQFQLLSLSARNIDQDWHNLGWFIPWQNLVQFVSPDYFGNPTTLNYWGVWNYGEFIGYIGIIPLIFALSAIFFRKDKKTVFFTSLIFISLAMALPTIVGKLPFRLHIPFLLSTQPTRIMYLIDFSLAVLAALGYDLVQKTKVKVAIPALVVLGVLVAAFLSGVIMNQSHIITAEQWKVTQRNLVLPLLFTAVACVFALGSFLDNKAQWVKSIRLTAFLLFSLVDLVLFANKFTPFAPREYYYPQTKLITFLQKNLGNHRIMSTDRSILHPNIPTFYHIQSVDGYDPLYLLTYGEFIAAMERRDPNITPPFGFNRILTPNSFFEKFGSLLGVKYLLSQQDFQEPYLKKVYTEGTIHVYENKNVLPRAFFVSSIRITSSKQQTINAMFEPNLSLGETAVVQTRDAITTKPDFYDTVAITTYKETNIIISTHSQHGAFLVLTDSYYPTWHAYIDGNETKIYQTDYAFRGVVVPAGKHTVEFKDSLF